MKQRITITIEDSIIEKIDKKVDGYKIKNRSHAIELLVSQSLGMNTPKTALIMSSGKLKKVKSENKEVSLKLAKINQKIPIEHLIELFKKYGIKKIFIAICYQKEEIKEYFGDGSKFDVDITYIEEDKPSGTSNLIRKIKPYINGPFFVTNDDELKDLDLDEMYKFHKVNNSMATIALTTINRTSNYGVVNLEGNKIISFTEKPKKNQSKIINSGLYLFNKEIIDQIPKKSKMLYDFLPKIASEKKLFGYIFTGQWFDIHNSDLFETAKKNWKNIEN